jgi:hypothetical protein
MPSSMALNAITTIEIVVKDLFDTGQHFPHHAPQKFPETIVPPSRAPKTTVPLLHIPIGQ